MSQAEREREKERKRGRKREREREREKERERERERESEDELLMVTQQVSLWFVTWKLAGSGQVHRVKKGCCKMFCDLKAASMTNNVIN